MELTIGKTIHFPFEGSFISGIISAVLGSNAVLVVGLDGKTHRVSPENVKEGLNENKPSG